MAKTRRGGQNANRVSRFARFRNGGVAPAQPQAQQQQPATPAPANAVGGNDPIAAFSQMSDAQKAALVQSASTARVKAGFPKTEWQKFLAVSGLDNTAPQLVSDAQLDAMSGNDFFRGVRSSNQTKVDDMIGELLTADATWHSDTGGSMVGRGIYLSPDIHVSAGQYAVGAPAGAVARFKLGSNARTIDHASLGALLRRDMSSGTAFGKELRRLVNAGNTHDAESICAASHNYNVITGGWTNAVLSRSALVASYDYVSVNGLQDSDGARRATNWKDLRRRLNQ